MFPSLPRALASPSPAVSLPPLSPRVCRGPSPAAAGAYITPGMARGLRRRAELSADFTASSEILRVPRRRGRGGGREAGAREGGAAVGGQTQWDFFVGGSPEPQKGKAGGFFRVNPPFL